MYHLKYSVKVDLFFNQIIGWTKHEIQRGENILLTKRDVSGKHKVSPWILKILRIESGPTQPLIHNFGW